MQSSRAWQMFNCFSELASSSVLGSADHPHATPRAPLSAALVQVQGLLIGISALAWLLFACPTLQSQQFHQDFEAVQAPALPAGWTTGGATGFTPAAVQQSTVFEGKNALYLPQQGSSVYGFVSTPSLLLAQGHTQLRFALLCRHDSSATGVILQIKIADADFVEFTTVGGLFQSGAYTSTPSFSVPVIGRGALWRSTTGEEYGRFIKVRALLPASSAGKQVSLRWLSASNTSFSPASQGCFIDDISISPVLDLSVSHTANLTELVAGNELSYTTVVSNPSAAAISNISLEVTLPWWSSLVEQQSAPGLSANFDSVGKVITYNIATLAAGASQQLKTKIRLAADAQSDPFLSISFPAEIAGDYAVRQAAFGAAPDFRGINGTVIRPRDSSGQPYDGCSKVAASAPDLYSNLVLALLGGCSAADKARLAQQQDARALLVHAPFYTTSFEPQQAQSFELPGEIKIPVLTLRSRDAERIIEAYHMSSASVFPSGTIRSGVYEIISTAQLRAQGLIEPNLANNYALARTTFFADPDQDQLYDQKDNCPRASNADQKDLDLDGIGDACDSCTDTDEDGFGDPGFSASTCAQDLCPSDEDKSAPLKCGCGKSESDYDDDGVPNCLDACPFDEEFVVKGICGCEPVGGDKDSDGTPDCADQCVFDPKKTQSGSCGCGIPEVDSDGDGAFDCVDKCPLDPARAVQGACGCGPELNADLDNDGLPGCLDLCPSDPLKSGPGVCGCGIIEADANVNAIADCLTSADFQQQLTTLSAELQSANPKKLSKPDQKALKARWQALVKELQATVNSKATQLAIQGAAPKLGALYKAFAKSMQPVLKLNAKSFAKDRKAALKKMQVLKKQLV